MPSDIFRNIIEQKIDIFASTFGDSASNIFTRDNKIIHPLEYGMYKERCAKELLSFTVNKEIGISDGFLITSNNKVSTQCDIVMYRNDTIPLIDNGITNFYPIEIVKGIGEIKSVLSKTEFAKALVKLANNKKMFEERKGILESKKGIAKEDDSIFSFLICNKLSFDVENINYDEIYKEIPVEYRHNAILSLQDGLYIYKLCFDELPEKQKERFINIGGNVNAESVHWYYPHHTEGEECYICDNSFISIDKGDKYRHIIDFLICIRILLRDVYNYDFDLIQYLCTNISNVFEGQDISLRK